MLVVSLMVILLWDYYKLIILGITIKLVYVKQK